MDKWVVISVRVTNHTEGMILGETSAYASCQEKQPSNTVRMLWCKLFCFK